MARLDGLLQSLQMDRVLFDSSPLNSQDATDEFEEASQKRKPKSPFRTTITGKRPIFRLIGRNQAVEVSELPKLAPTPTMKQLRLFD